MQNGTVNCANYHIPVSLVGSYTISNLFGESRGYPVDKLMILCHEKPGSEFSLLSFAKAFPSPMARVKVTDIFKMEIAGMKPKHRCS